MRFSRYVARRLARSKQRSFTSTIINIAVVVVAMSLAVMLITTALINGFQKEISGKIFGFWGHIVINDIRADNSYESLPITYDPELVASIEDIAQVEVDYGLLSQHKGKSKAGVSHVQAVALVPAIISTREAMEGIVIKGLGEDYDWDIMQKFLVDGELFAGSAPDASEIILSQQTANRLEVGVGDSFIIHFLKDDRQTRRKFQVSGIYRTGLEEYDRKYAFAPLGTTQDLLGWDRDMVAAYEVFVENVDDADILNDYIYVEELPSSLYSQTIRSKFPAIFDWLELQDINMIVILGLTILVAVINMISVLLVLILDRTHMIGLFKALGAGNLQIQEIFLNHAAFIILRGMVLGNVAGMLLCGVQYWFRPIKLNEEDYYLSYAPVDVELLHVAAINGLALLVIMLCLILPSFLVARIDPVRTIKFG